MLGLLVLHCTLRKAIQNGANSEEVGEGRVEVGEQMRKKGAKRKEEEPAHLERTKTQL